MGNIHNAFGGTTFAWDVLKGQPIVTGKRLCVLADFNATVSFTYYISDKVGTDVGADERHVIRKQVVNTANLVAEATLFASMVALKRAWI